MQVGRVNICTRKKSTILLLFVFVFVLHHCRPLLSLEFTFFPIRNREFNVNTVIESELNKNNNLQLYTAGKVQQCHGKTNNKEFVSTFV